MNVKNYFTSCVGGKITEKAVRCLWNNVFVNFSHPANLCKCFMNDLRKICFQKTISFTSSNHLPSILHLPPQNRAKDHLNILHKRIIPIIIAIQPHLVGIDDRVVILRRYFGRRAGRLAAVFGHQKTLPKNNQAGFKSCLCLYYKL